MSQTKGANSRANSFKSRLGMLSGPTAFDVNNTMRTTERKRRLIQLLDLVHEEVNGLNDQFQDLCKTRRNFASEWDSRVQWNSLQGQVGQDFIFPKR